MCQIWKRKGVSGEMYICGVGQTNLHVDRGTAEIEALVALLDLMY